MQGFNYTAMAKLPQIPHFLFIAVPGDVNAPSADVQLVQRYLDAVERGDDAAAKTLLADDVILHVPGRSPVSGSYKGVDDVLEYVHKVMQLSNGTYKRDIVIWLVMSPHIHNVTLEHAERNGRGFDFNRSTVYEVRDGKIADIQIHEEDQYAVDEFWA